MWLKEGLFQLLTSKN